MMAVVEGIPLDALAERRRLGLDVVRATTWAASTGGIAVNAGFLVGHSTVRRVVMGDAATRDAATPGAAARPWSAWWRSRWPVGRSGSRPRSAKATSTATAAPVPSRAGRLRTSSWPWPARCGATPAPPSSSSPRWGPSPPTAWSSWPTCRWPPTGPSTGTCSAAWRRRRSTTSSSRPPTSPRPRGAHVVALALPDMMRMRADNLLAGLPGWRRRPPARRRRGDGRRRPTPTTRAELRAGARGHSPARPWASSPTSRLMEVADPASAWVGPVAGRDRRGRGTDVIDVLIDVVLVERLALFMVLPSLTPSLGRSDEGWRVRTSVWKDPRVMLGGSDAGAHVDLMCHANYPTVVLGEVVRDRGLLAARRGGRDDDRPPGPPLRAAPPGPGGRRAGTPTWSSSTRPRSAQPSRRAPSATSPAGASGSMPRRTGLDARLRGGPGGRRRTAQVTGARPGTVLRSGRDTDTVSLADVRRSPPRR